MNLQNELSNNELLLQPLSTSDFERLYIIASDPLIWEQHPNPDRYKREVFQVYFEGAIESKGAYLILDQKMNEVIGCTRFYDYDREKSSILIGYTFFSRSCWGKGINQRVKQIMLDYIFQFVDKVYFHIGANNIRSQIAIERLGAIKVRSIDIAYHGEVSHINFEYLITKEQRQD
jgi:RimJ/RimL family protein N-acetyltransferase